MSNKNTNNNQTSNYRKIGFILSTACLIHCLLVPIFLIVSPLIGHQFHLSIYAEALIYLLAFIFGIISLQRDYKQHKKTLPIILFVVGFIAVILSHFFTVQSIIILTLVIGSICLIGGQMMNFRLHRQFH